MSLYIITVTWADGHIERSEVEASDGAEAAEHAIRACPRGGTVAIRPAPTSWYPEDFEPSVPGDFDERACLSRGGSA